MGRKSEKSDKVVKQTVQRSSSTKRKKSVTSPDLASVVPDKRTMNESYLQSLNSPAPSSFPQNLQSGQVPYNVGNGQFFTPPTQYNAMASQGIQQNSVSPHFQQSLFEKLDQMDKRLVKLDNIEKQITTLTQKFTVIDSRVTSLETKLEECKHTLTEIEASRSFDSQTSDEIRQKQQSIDKHIEDENNKLQKLSEEFEKMKGENKRISNEIIVMQSRSMRDNLLFYNFDECPSVEERKSENCSTKVLDYVRDSLDIADAHTSIKIDRAHRVGRFTTGKKRPIVVKFNYHQDKLLIKDKILNMEDPPHKVSDQYPKEMQDRRRKLIPDLIKAKQSGKNAYLRGDKLIIENKIYTADSLPIPENVFSS